MRASAKCVSIFVWRFKQKNELLRMWKSDKQHSYNIRQKKLIQTLLSRDQLANVMRVAFGRENAMIILTLSWNNFLRMRVSAKCVCIFVWRFKQKKRAVFKLSNRKRCLSSIFLLVQEMGVEPTRLLKVTGT